MPETTPPPPHRMLKADAVAAGQQLLLRDGSLSAPVRSASIERDDFGLPALVVAELADGTRLRLAAGSIARIAVSPGEADDAAAPQTTGAEAVFADVSAAYPDDPMVQEVAGRLIRGLNLRSGSNLQDVRDLAVHLFTVLDDSSNALRVCGLITDLPFDGTFGRWISIESCLAISAYITRQAGDDERADAFAEALRVPDFVETDPLRVKLNAEVRQRHLNEPNLNEREIGRAVAAGDHDAEMDWRRQRLGTLLYLRVHGGSETFDDAELDRLIGQELEAMRAR